MRDSKFINKLGSHFLALILGGLVTFGSLQLFPSPVKADLEAPITSPIAQTTTKPTTTAAIPVSTSLSPESFVAAAVERTGDAVVRIDTEKTVTRQFDPFMDDPFFREFFGDRLRQSIPDERRITGQGSGFITSKDGLILTNAHVVSGADRVTVTLKDGRSFDGIVRGTDEVTDLAVVKIEPKGQDLPIAPLGDSSTLKVGDWAIAVGNPVGLNNTVTLGIISTLERSSAQVGIPDKRVDFLQTDAAINPGNSGGPLLNAKGEVIGINTAIRADAMGIGFAIPINKAKNLENTLASGQAVPHPYVGIQMVSLTQELAKQNNNDPNSPFLVPEVDGVLVVRVLQNTPAEKSGLRRGDVITKIDNKPVKTAEELQSIVENSGINKNLKFSVKRGNQDLQLTVTTAQMKKE